MCGLFGYSGNNFSPALMQRIAEHTEDRRGGHAFGFAWRTRDGRTRMYKQPGPLTCDAFDMCSDAVAIIGHVRLATFGIPEHNINNHPHPSDGGWVVHNGTIRNHRHLESTHDINRISNCDSEVFAQLIEVLPGQSRKARIKEALQLCNVTPLAFLGLWGSTIVAASQGNPLHSIRVKDGIYLASLAESLPQNAIRFDSSKVVSITHARGVSCQK